jgi:perosamine synthetase
MGQGGIIVTQDEKIHIRLRELKDQGRPQRGTGGSDIHVSLGYNFKLTNLQAAVGLSQLKKLEFRLQRMKEIYTIYQKHLKEVEEAKLVPIQIKNGLSPQWIDAIVENRDALVDYLSKSGIDTRKFWLPIHTQKPYLHHGDYQETTFVSARGLWLPSSFNLNNREINFVCKKIKDFYASKMKGLQ